MPIDYTAAFGGVSRLRRAKKKVPAFRIRKAGALLLACPTTSFSRAST